MRGFTSFGVGLPPAVEALLLARYPSQLADMGHFSAVWFADQRGPKVVLLYNHFVWPNIGIHVAAREGALWCYPDILYHIFAYPFEQLGCTRVTAPIKSTNRASIRTVEALGFTLEGTLRHAGRNGEDTLLYGMLKEECRWINHRKAA